MFFPVHFISNYNITISTRGSSIIVVVIAVPIILIANIVNWCRQNILAAVHKDILIGHLLSKDWGQKEE
jgi:hypothetical protein